MIDKPYAVSQEDSDHLDIPAMWVVACPHLLFPGYANGREAVVLPCRLDISGIQLGVSLVNPSVYLNHCLQSYENILLLFGSRIFDASTYKAYSPTVRSKTYVWGTCGDAQHPNGASAVNNSYTNSEDQGHYEQQATGKHWVVDVVGHWE